MKKLKYLMTFILTSIIVFANNVNAAYCTGENAGLGPTVKFIGHIVQVAKIFIPIIIIVLGFVDFAKAMVGSKPDDLKPAAMTVAKRLAAGVIIFFLPAFVDFIFGWVSGFQNDVQSNYNECFTCIWDVSKCS